MQERAPPCAQGWRATRRLPEDARVAEQQMQPLLRPEAVRPARSVPAPRERAMGVPLLPHARAAPTRRVPWEALEQGRGAGRRVVGHGDRSPRRADRLVPPVRTCATILEAPE